MSVDFTPSMREYKNTGTFKFWCQKVLPLVYDDSLSYYELLCKVVNYLNDVIQNADALDDNVRGLYNAYVHLQEYVNNYIDNLDVQNEINNKLDNMANDGSLSRVIIRFLPFVTPEMYGAIGDGVTDDTIPIKMAIESGLNVEFNANKIYYTETMNLLNNRVYDFNNCVIKSKNKNAIISSGVFKSKTTLREEYNANDRNIKLNANVEVGDLLVIKDTTNIFYNENNIDYYGGGTVKVEKINSDGSITIFPSIDFDLSLNTEIDIYTPNSVIIKNIGNFIFDDITDSETYAIDLKYNVNSIIENVKNTNTNRGIISINGCYKCTIKNCNLKTDFIPQVIYFYIIAISSSYKTVIDNSIIQSTWHAISTVGNNAVINTTVQNCVLECSAGYPAYLDHGCGINTTIENTDLDNVFFTNGCVMNNCRIYDRDDDDCYITIATSNYLKNNEYIFKDVVFHGERKGYFRIENQRNDLNSYIKTIICENVYDIKYGDIFTFQTTNFNIEINNFIMTKKVIDISGLNDTTKIKNLIISNAICDGQFYILNNSITNLVVNDIIITTISQGGQLFKAKHVTVNNCVITSSICRCDLSVSSEYCFLNNVILETNEFGEGVLYIPTNSVVYANNCKFERTSYPIGVKLNASNCYMNNSTTDKAIFVDSETGQLQLVKVVNGEINIIAIN